MKQLLFVIMLSLLASACTQYSLIEAGPQAVGSFSIEPRSSWNQSPFKIGPNTTVWTKDGPALNQIIFFDGIADGKPIMSIWNRELPAPKFKADMLPNEIAELVETTIRNANGGKVEVNSTNLRPQTLAGQIAFRFDLDYFNIDGLAKSGEVVALIREQKLYMLMFDAAAQYYRYKDAEEINQMIENLSLSS